MIKITISTVQVPITEVTSYLSKKGVMGLCLHNERAQQPMFFNVLTRAGASKVALFTIAGHLGSPPGVLSLC